MGREFIAAGKTMASTLLAANDMSVGTEVTANKTIGTRIAARTGTVIVSNFTVGIITVISGATIGNATTVTVTAAATETTEVTSLTLFWPASLPALEATI
jgi:hypothetical protein